MTVHQLSSTCVKVQVTAEEVRNYAAPEGIMRLICRMLLRAEEISRIPLSALPVSVELLAAENGALTAYFTVCSPPKHTRRRAARFQDYETLKECCRQLMQFRADIRRSRLHQYADSWILSLEVNHDAPAPRHLLLEYGIPFRLSSMNCARLSELGVCLHEADAVEKTAAES